MGFEGSLGSLGSLGCLDSQGSWGFGGSVDSVDSVAWAEGRKGEEDTCLVSDCELKFQRWMDGLVVFWSFGSGKGRCGGGPLIW